MQICDDCRELDGKPSSSGPHQSLRYVTSLESGAASPLGMNKTKKNDQYKCSECETLMYKCTEHDDESPGHWRAENKAAG